MITTKKKNATHSHTHESATNEQKYALKTNIDEAIANGLCDVETVGVLVLKST